METVADFIFLGSKITADGDRSEIKRQEMATHSSILAWRIPWREEPGRLQSTTAQSRTRLSYFPFTFTPWKESYDQPRQHIKKQRLYFAEKVLSGQSYGFSSSHVLM